jgi:dipeptidyl aminopeptidase/acylaminoacyl peptidase
MKRFWLAALAAVSCTAVARDELPLDHFIKHASFLDVKISPTGEYLAASVMASEDSGALVIMRRDTREVTGTMKLAGRTFVNQFEWVNGERLVLSVAEKDGSKSNPRGTGELYATNWDGKKQELLIGPRKQSSLESAKRKARYEGAALIDGLLDDDKHVLVQVWGVGNEEGSYPTIERLNVYTGGRSRLARAPVMNAFFATDRAGEVRFAAGAGVDNRLKLYYRDDNDAKWRLVNDEAESGLQMYAVGFTADGKRGYVRAEEQQGPDSIYEWNPATNERKLVARDDVADPLSLVYDRREVGPVGVVFMDGVPSLKILDKEAEEIALLRALMPSFPGEWVSLRSFSDDGKLVVFSVTSDRNPGSFYLFDRDAGKATFLLAGREWIDPDRMADMKPIRYVARDGTPVHGYLTLPPGSDGKGLPLIVNPHGGPFGPFDDWSFNPEVQLFANRGYAVLQVNFRGSGNYGRAFQRLGYQQWGGTMQDDLTDATKWAVAEGIADPDRICIYGASYGAYAAAMGVAKEPELYRCAVGYVGVYDMQMMYTRGDIQERDSGLNFLEEALGGGKENLRARSPTALAERIEAPMFIVVGNEDVRAHPAHSKAMRDALERAGKDVEYLAKDYEGHGFFKEENNRELYTKMLAFFEKHIGKGESASAAASAASAE